MAEIKVATDANFQELVLSQSDRSSSTSGPPGAARARWSRRRWRSSPSKYDGTIEVVKVDVDANPSLSQAFNIMSIPTIAFFKPGAQPQGVVGFRPLEQLEQFSLKQFAPVAVE